ncbi:MAG: SIS domain-containing protein [bacterium]
MEHLKEYITEELAISVKTKEKFVKENLGQLMKAVELMAQVTLNGGKIIYFGNGGSAADSQHLAAEHVNKLRVQRAALPAIAITTDTSAITSIANDLSFDEIFSRQIEAVGNKNDLAFGISTSGNSSNVIRGLQVARQMGMKTISMTGGSGGRISSEDLADVVLNVDNSNVSSRIQETHIFIGHILIELMDKILMTK